MDAGHLVPLAPIAPPHPSGAAVIELLEDDAGRLARCLNAGDPATQEGTKAGAWGEDCYSGICSLKVAGLQRYREQIPGWNFPVVEKPKPGEYRYLRFAWKKPDSTGIMVQLCVSGQDWGRYFAGQNNTGYYPALQVQPQVPREWTVVTRDLFADFGSIPLTLTGLAFTSMGGVALFDHVYLGRTIEDLDKITTAAKEWATKSESLGTTQLEQHWKNLASEDASIRLPSLWALGAGGSSSSSFVSKKIEIPDSQDVERKLARAVADLDSPRFAVREQASKDLDRFGLTALPFMEVAWKPGISQEWHMRLEKLIAKCKAGDGLLTPSQLQILRAVRVLEATGTPEAKTLLETLSKSTLEAGLSAEAKAAVERIAKRKK
ncbi:MAG: hypothetical protein EXS09_04055 [Gemmataceae bacterium]|nr:hypothetical protein [Gemmataceae bacterium]